MEGLLEQISAFSVNKKLGPILSLPATLSPEERKQARQLVEDKYSLTLKAESYGVGPGRTIHILRRDVEADDNEKSSSSTSNNAANSSTTSTGGALSALLPEADVDEEDNLFVRTSPTLELRRDRLQRESEQTKAAEAGGGLSFITQTLPPDGHVSLPGGISTSTSGGGTARTATFTDDGTTLLTESLPTSPQAAASKRDKRDKDKVNVSVKNTFLHISEVTTVMLSMSAGHAERQTVSMPAGLFMQKCNEERRRRLGRSLDFAATGDRGGKDDFLRTWDPIENTGTLRYNSRGVPELEISPGSSLAAVDANAAPEAEAAPPAVLVAPPVKGGAEAEGVPKDKEKERPSPDLQPKRPGSPSTSSPPPSSPPPPAPGVSFSAPSPPRTKLGGAAALDGDPQQDGATIHSSREGSGETQFAPFGRTSGPTPSSPSRSPIPSAAAPPLRNEFLIGQTVECTSDVIEAYNGLRGVVCNINYEPNRSGLCYDVSFQQNQHAVGAGAAGWQTTTTSQYNHDVDGAAGGWPMSMPAAASRSDHLQPFGLVGVHGQVHEQVHVDGGPGNASASTSQRPSPYPPPWDVGSSCSMVGMSMPSAAVSPGGAPGGVSQAYSPHDQKSSQHGRQLQNHNQNHDQHDLQASGFYNYDGSSFTYDQHGAGAAPGQPHPTQYQAAPAVEIMDQHHVAPTMLQQQQQQQQHEHHINIHVDGYNSGVVSGAGGGFPLDFNASWSNPWPNVTLPQHQLRAVAEPFVPQAMRNASLPTAQPGRAEEQAAGVSSSSASISGATRPVLGEDPDSLNAPPGLSSRGFAIAPASTRGAPGTTATAGADELEFNQNTNNSNTSSTMPGIGGTGTDPGSAAPAHQQHAQHSSVGTATSASFSGPVAVAVGVRPPEVLRLSELLPEKGNEGGMGDRFADLEWLFRTEGLRRIKYELNKRRSYNHKSRAGREKRSNAGGNYNYNGGNANARNHNNYERSGSSAVSGKYNGYDVGYHGTQHGNSSSSPRGGGYDDGSGGLPLLTSKNAAQARYEPPSKQASRGSSGAFPAGTGAVYTAFNNGFLRPDSSSH